jgi:hypothetical protein
MSVTNCSQFLSQLDEWMEGQRAADAQAHLRTCVECSSIVEDLHSIHQTARSLGAIPAEPPERIWTSLRWQLEREGLIHGEPRRWTEAVIDWFRAAFSSVPRPALAGAYMLALVGIGVALAGPGYQRFHWNEKGTLPLRAQLNAAERNTLALADSDPAVAASLEKNLAIVDYYIALCEKSVQEDPESEVARDYLYNAYQQKADLLAQMSELGAGQ